MPVKNNLEIYEHLYRYITSTFVTCQLCVFHTQEHGYILRFVGPNTCRPWKRVLPDAFCSRESCSPKNKHHKSTTYAVYIQTGME